MEVEIIFGHTYQDKVTKFAGTAVAKTEWWTGCTRVCLEALIDGKPYVEWFDIGRLHDLTVAVQNDEAEADVPAMTPGIGGPQRDPAPPSPGRR